MYNPYPGLSGPIRHQERNGKTTKGNLKTIKRWC